MDNHDVDRIYSKLNEKRHIFPVYALLYTLPGIPSVYYGSEFGIEGRKQGPNDDPLRPQINLDEIKRQNPNEKLTQWIAALGKIRKEKHRIVARGIQRITSDKPPVCLCKDSGWPRSDHSGQQ